MIFHIQQLFWILYDYENKNFTKYFNLLNKASVYSLHITVFIYFIL